MSLSLESSSLDYKLFVRVGLVSIELSGESPAPGVSLVANVKNTPANVGDAHLIPWVRKEEGMETHSSILA